MIKIHFSDINTMSDETITEQEYLEWAADEAKKARTLRKRAATMLRTAEWHEGYAKRYRESAAQTAAQAAAQAATSNERDTNTP